MRQELQLEGVPSFCEGGSHAGTLLQRSKEHCLVGIKGTVRRGHDAYFIHANIDTDVIVSEEPQVHGSTEKPEELYRVIERFCLGRRRIELFGNERNVRSGWLTVGAQVAESNYNPRLYNSWFEGDKCYPLAKDYMGGRYVGTTHEIEELRPRSPKQQTGLLGMPSSQGTFSSALGGLMQ